MSVAQGSEIQVLADHLGISFEESRQRLQFDLDSGPLSEALWARFGPDVLAYTRLADDRVALEIAGPALTDDQVSEALDLAGSHDIAVGQLVFVEVDHTASDLTAIQGMASDAIDSVGIPAPSQTLPVEGLVQVFVSPEGAAAANEAIAALDLSPEFQQRLVVVETNDSFEPE